MLPVPTIPEEAREDLTNLMQELLMKAHELSFEYSISECEKIRECAFASKAKELFKVVKRLYELTRKITPPERIRAVT